LSYKRVSASIPRFNTTRYEFATPENQRRGAVIGQVRATDADAGDNARLTYSVARVSGRDERGPLSVDPRSGDVVVVGRLDYERRADYVLTVAATDHAAPPPLRHVGFTRVVVRLLDQVMTSDGLSTKQNRQLPKARHGAGARPVHCEFFYIYLINNLVSDFVTQLAPQPSDQPASQLFKNSQNTNQ